MHIYRMGELLPPHFYFQAEAAIRIIFEFSSDIGSNSDPQMMHVLIASGRELIAYTGIICKTIEHQGATYKCYGLSGVLTFPAHRKKGHGKRLIEAATNLI